MARYIDADLLKEQMYHEAFEKPTVMQRWDSGCWIRYKMFENVIASIPTADVVEVVRCKDCHHWKTELEPTGIECEPGENAHICWMDGMITRTNDYCSYGRRK